MDALKRQSSFAGSTGSGSLQVALPAVIKDLVISLRAVNSHISLFRPRCNLGRAFRARF